MSYVEIHAHAQLNESKAESGHGCAVELVNGLHESRLVWHCLSEHQQPDSSLLARDTMLDSGSHPLLAPFPRMTTPM
jgi:hypothetical protein